MKFARVTVIVGLAVAQCLVAVGTAHAASGSVWVADGALIMRADGQANRVTVSASDGRLVVTDVAELTAGDGCDNVSRTEVSCSLAGVEVVHVDLGDGDDSANLAAPQPSVVNGGDGNDVLSGGGGKDTLSGGPGGDYLYGGDGADALYGGPGADELVGGLHADSLDGGTGDDLIDGSDNMRDSVNYLFRSNPVTVNLADGKGGEGPEVDTILNVQNIHGGSGDDLLTGNADSNFIWGNGGFDTIDGGPGVDQCDGEAVTSC